MSAFNFGAGAPAFGAQQPAQPAAPSGGMFGAQQNPAPATTFGFGGTSAPSAPSSSFNFGGPAAPAPAAGGFQFGGSMTNTTAPAAGAPAQTTGFNFGGTTTGTSTAPAAPSSSFSFGATTTAAPAAAPAAAGGFQFGGPTTAAPAAAAAPAAGGFNFGSSAPASGGGLFGGSSAAPAATNTFNFAASTQPQQPSTGTFGRTGLFGASTSTATPQAPTTTTNLFGQGGQTTAGGAPTGGAPGQAPAAPYPDERLLKEVWAIKDSLDGAGPSYKFRSLLLNVVPPRQRLRPNHVSDSEWRDAMERAGGANNADHLWPVLASGFSDLNSRKGVQEAVLAEDTARREQVAEIIKLYRRNIEVNLQGRIENARRRQGELLRGLVQLLRLIDALEGRLAAQMGMTGDRHALGMLQERVRSLEFLLDSPQGLQRKVDGLHAAMNRMHSGRAPSTTGGLTQRGDGAGALAANGSDGLRTDPASMQQLHEALRVQVEAATKLQDVLLRSQRNLAILEAEARSSSSRRH